MDNLTIGLGVVVAGFVIEKAVAIYKKVMADGKVTLDEIIEAVESQIRTDEQFTVLADSQQNTQEMINDIGKKVVNWMMAIGSVLITAIVGGQVMI